MSGLLKEVPDCDPREFCKIRYSAPPEACKCGNCQLVPPEHLVRWSDQMETLQAQLAEAEERNIQWARGNVVNQREKVALEVQLASAKGYVERAIASYEGDPADNNFQRGYLAALEVVRDEAFSTEG